MVQPPGAPGDGRPVRCHRSDSLDGGGMKSAQLRGEELGAGALYAHDTGREAGAADDDFG